MASPLHPFRAKGLDAVHHIQHNLGAQIPRLRPACPTGRSHALLATLKRQLCFRSSSLARHPLPSPVLGHIHDEGAMEMQEGPEY